MKSYGNRQNQARSQQADANSLPAAVSVAPFLDLRNGPVQQVQMAAAQSPAHLAQQQRVMAQLASVRMVAQRQRIAATFGLTPQDKKPVIASAAPARSVVQRELETDSDGNSKGTQADIETWLSKFGANILGRKSQ